MSRLTVSVPPIRIVEVMFELTTFGNRISSVSIVVFEMAKGTLSNKSVRMPSSVEFALAPNVLFVGTPPTEINELAFCPCLGE